MTELVEETHYCPVHPDAEATLNCIRCGRYMCVRCVRQTPVGYVCAECFRQQDSSFFKGTNTDAAIIFAVCAVLTGLGAAIVSATRFPFFLLLLFGFPIGAGVAEVALRLTQRRRTRYAERLAAGACVLGGLIGGLLPSLSAYNAFVNQLPPQVRAQAPSLIDFAFRALLSDWGLLLFIAIVAFGVYSRYRVRI